MHAAETLVAVRVVASREALDAMTIAAAPSAPGLVLVLRTAPDEALLIGVAAAAVSVPDEHAIIEGETGFSGLWFSPAEFDELVRPHIEWAIPTVFPVLAQGRVAAVPAKVWFESGRILLVFATAYTDDLVARLRMR